MKNHIFLIYHGLFHRYSCIHLNYFITISDDDLPGAHLLAEAKFSLQKIFPQMQKKFQISLERPNLRVSEDENIVIY